MKACWSDMTDVFDASSSLQRPSTRAARLSAVEQALLTHVITSQSQLSEILSSQGIEVTQATLSRDLDELRATKTRLADGTLAYAVGASEGAHAASHPAAASMPMDGTGKAEQQISRVLSGLMTSVAFARNLIVVHTPSGAAQYVGSVIDKQPIEGVLGTIAGDDTVMIICADDDTAKSRSEWLLRLVTKE